MGKSCRIVYILLPFDIRPRGIGSGNPDRLCFYRGDAMQTGGLPFEEARAKRIPIDHSMDEVKAWRTGEHDAGRPSGFEDFCRAHGVRLCTACMGEGVTRNEDGLGFKPVGWDGDTQLFEMCPACGGTGQIELA
ncbi:MAG: hypothetical protein WA294_20970 [Acidobacteriaceae bacterium]